MYNWWGTSMLSETPVGRSSRFRNPLLTSAVLTSVLLLEICTLFKPSGRLCGGERERKKARREHLSCGHTEHIKCLWFPTALGNMPCKLLLFEYKLTPTYVIYPRHTSSSEIQINQSWALLISKRSPVPLPLFVFKDPFDNTLSLTWCFSAAYLW